MTKDTIVSPILIILVEDDANLRQSFALILQRAGYMVTATDCVYEALDLIQKDQYKLLISDVNIPEIKKVLLPKVVGHYPNLPIVILTDQSSSEIDHERRLFGAQYLVKPVAPERLLESIGSILGKKNDSSYTNGTARPVHPI